MCRPLRSTAAAAAVTLTWSWSDAADLAPRGPAAASISFLLDSPFSSSATVANRRSSSPGPSPPTHVHPPEPFMPPPPL
ncbi:hypothetical protein TYRP_002446 [Tyrophagus putrescentiae]|nr:hypothetical protein TYRP_002446 [Tyrophagus putrescentiae]